VYLLHCLQLSHIRCTVVHRQILYWSWLYWAKLKCWSSASSWYIRWFGFTSYTAFCSWEHLLLVSYGLSMCWSTLTLMWMFLATNAIHVQLVWLFLSLTITSTVVNCPTFFIWLIYSIVSWRYPLTLQCSVVLYRIPSYAQCIAFSMQ